MQIDMGTYTQRQRHKQTDTQYIAINCLFDKRIGKSKRKKERKEGKKS